jgi:hypothetical protein
MPSWLQMSRNYNNPESVNYKLAYLREQIGDAEFGKLAYADQVELAMLGETVILGGFLRTELLAAKSIQAKHLAVDDYVELEGTGLKIYRDTAKTDLAAHHGQYEEGKYGSRWMHSDGSYTQAGVEGFIRHIAGTDKDYHYLLHVGSGAINSLGWSNELIITLPEEFKGKPFNIFVALRQVHTGVNSHALGTMQVAGGVKSRDDGTIWVVANYLGFRLASTTGFILDALNNKIVGSWLEHEPSDYAGAIIDFTYIAIA